ncbi:MAG: cytochrome c-type biogenesis CcmF C-terminal domain-containing protein [Anaerolineae bacterium]|jgi:cytochrome c-type biogenesis protein CcmF|nr:cytochrome c-type biogenesis CcmF C-terminal domain-containing protein [Anaerolineae bacterium]
MLSQVGTFCIGLALALALYAVGATLWGIRNAGGATGSARWTRSGQHATRATAAVLGGALLALSLAFLSNAFEIAYVAQHSATYLPLALKLSALWAGQEGSLLLWCGLQAFFAALALSRPAVRARRLVPWATVFLNLITAFFVAVTLFRSNPFTALPHVPLEGQGLNPLLRHPGMIFHPPALYVGYVGLAVPFAFALAALVTRQVEDWTAALRLWILLAWLGLGLGLLLGMRWAYDVLGWGGYWGWDPVENAGLLPWLTTTALLHGAVMQEERRGFRVWNILLVVASFALVLFGTFATRSGLIQSVHAYVASDLGGLFLFAIGVTLLGALGLMLARRAELVAGAPPPESLFSRAGLFYLTLLVFGTLTCSIFIGSILPTLTQALWGQRLEAGPAWFDQVTGPQFAALVFLMGVCPLLGRAARALRRQRVARQRWSWVALLAGALLAAGLLASAGFTNPISLAGFALVGATLASTLFEIGSGVAQRCAGTGAAPLNALWQLLRTRQRTYGGALVHMGVALLALGVIGTRLYPFERELTLSAGAPVEVGGYTLVFEELQQVRGEDHLASAARLALYRGAIYLATLEPRLEQYAGRQTVTVPALRSGLRDDVYVTLAGWSENGARVTLKVVVNALINALWAGGLVLLAGGALAFYPRNLGRRWNTLALALGILGLCGAAWAMWGLPHGATRAEAGRPPVGQAAPDFRLMLLDGSTLALEDLRGKVTVVNFWASWCPPCQEELPALREVWEATREEAVALVGIAYQDEEAAVRAAVDDDGGIPYPVGLDAGKRIAGQYGITGVPETFVINAEGNVAFWHIGPVTADVLLAEIRALLGSP